MNTDKIPSRGSHAMTRLPLRLWLCLLICVHLCSSAVPSLRGAAWTHWRGPTANGVSSETGLPDSFKVASAGKDNLVWKAPYGCRSTPIVLNGRVYFNTHTGGDKIEEQESVICLDEKTGKKLWQYKFNVYYADIVSSRVG